MSSHPKQSKAEIPHAQGIQDRTRDPTFQEVAKNRQYFYSSHAYFRLKLLEVQIVPLHRLALLIGSFETNPRIEALISRSNSEEPIQVGDKIQAE